MSDTRDIEDRRGALETFAKSANQEISTRPAGGTGSGLRVVGAQLVAVKRDEEDVRGKIAIAAARAGDDWYYSWEAKDTRTGKKGKVEGPTIKCANEIARLFGNNEIETRVEDFGDVWIITARFTDYESGFSMTRPFQQRKGQRTMGGDDRQRDAAFSTGVSKAIRNVIVNSLQSFADFAFEEAQNALVKKIAGDLPNQRKKVIEKLQTKVDIKRAEIVIGRVAKEWNPADVAQVAAMMRAVAEGMTSLDEAFPPLVSQEPAKDALGDFAKKNSDDGTTPSDEAAAEGNSSDRVPAAAANNKLV